MSHCHVNSQDSVYYWVYDDGIWASVDGQPEYFRNHHELHMYALEGQRELIQVTPEIETDLRKAGAFCRGGHDE